MERAVSCVSRKFDARFLHDAISLISALLRMEHKVSVPVVPCTLTCRV